MSKDYTITDSKDVYTLNIDVNIENDSWNVLKNLDSLIVDISKKTFKYLNIDKHAKHIEYSILFTDDASIQKLNAQYRNKNYPTNTLSFPIEDNQDGFITLGDIIFAYEIILKESNEQNKAFVDHFTHLLIHSLLHLLGYDHVYEEEAAEMEALETAILLLFNINSPYLG